MCVSHSLELCQVKTGTAGWRPEDIIKVRFMLTKGTHHSFLNGAREDKSQLSLAFKMGKLNGFKKSGLRQQVQALAPLAVWIWACVLSTLSLILEMEIILPSL